MTDTIDSVTRQIFEVVRGVAAPMFTERGFVDVANRLSTPENMGALLEAFDYAEQVCACPSPVLAAFHDLRTAMQRVKEVRDAGGMDANKLAFAKLQALHAAGLFQAARQ